MGREDILLRGITKNQRGIEIAPWFRPLVPKREGYHSLSLDLFDRNELLRRAVGDPNINPDDHWRIESVDFIGSATDIGELVASKGLSKTFDYVVSSHNFEHLPNPVRFLRGCEAALKADGLISMAVPDRRACFDFFRPHTTTADFVAAYREHQVRPTPRQRFEQESLRSQIDRDGRKIVSFTIQEDPSEVWPCEYMRIGADEAIWANADAYIDVHCSVFTPASFRLIMLDLRFLNLISLILEDISGPSNDEFYVRLRKPSENAALPKESYYRERSELLHLIWDEAAANTRLVRALMRERDDLKAQLAAIA